MRNKVDFDLSSLTENNCADPVLVQNKPNTQETGSKKFKGSPKKMTKLIVSCIYRPPFIFCKKGGNIRNFEQTLVHIQKTFLTKIISGKKASENIL